MCPPQHHHALCNAIHAQYVTRQSDEHEVEHAVHRGFLHIHHLDPDHLFLCARVHEAPAVTLTLTDLHTRPLKPSLSFPHALTTHAPLPSRHRFLFAAEMRPAHTKFRHIRAVGETKVCQVFRKLHVLVVSGGVAVDKANGGGARSGLCGRRRHTDFGAALKHADIPIATFLPLSLYQHDNAHEKNVCNTTYAMQRNTTRQLTQANADWRYGQAFASWPTASGTLAPLRRTLGNPAPRCPASQAAVSRRTPDCV